MLLLQVKFVLGVFLFCVTSSSCNDLFCSFKFVVMKLCILTSFKPGNIYFLLSVSNVDHVSSFSFGSHVSSCFEIPS